MSRISMELERLESAIDKLEKAVEAADRRQTAAVDSAWRQAGAMMDLTVEQVDRAIHRLETVLEE